MRLRKFIVSGIIIFGISSILWGGYGVINKDWPPYFFDMCILSFLFLLISPWSVIMPSGASWRPGISIVMFSAMVFPTSMALFIPLPGLLYISYKNRSKGLQFLLTIGHINLGMIGTGFFFKKYVFLSENTFYLFLIVFLSLCIHFFINRIVAACIIAFKKNISIYESIREIQRDLNWGFFNTYVISYLMFFQYYYIGIVGLLPTTLLLIGIYRSAHYFMKAQDLKTMAYTDALTGAENRASWERLNNSQEKLRGTFALMDLNDFKIINDTLGHAKGDQLLRELVFNILSDPYTQLRLFRYGGDEFVLFVPHERIEKEIIKNRIKQMIMDQEITWGSKGYPVTVSYGMVYFEGNAEKLSEYIKLADERMYKNKYKRKKLKPFAIK